MVCFTLREHYITSAGWLPDSSSFAITWTSRTYNVSIISICPADTCICDEVCILCDKTGADKLSSFVNSVCESIIP